MGLVIILSGYYIQLRLLYHLVIVRMEAHITLVDEEPKLKVEYCINQMELVIVLFIYELR
jgi:hypothetical protein